ncbi:LacI family DNA-binding transcriptional regulator [Neptunomonas phycophila]|jgi:DNA-binding LacI/PurR family transcriptional regulator|uniref:LacI family DNA-binding transcriptional regulator n=1 Tax=Neptunomonas phycophila TaxID=1572645 RepID=A0AAW7XCX2_9GAMM|nr:MULTISPECIES: LacI family DNA-binding transcriptional regulator [Neptunomonas]MBT3146336.1 LacI family DNA-binding transcriptional regulator [Neptunomonas phycophila]MDN2659492.1 LacI family DNA-binding transcriptional regulator [Neptunomonas sp. CHC150]MDO6452031.1 LacI family DNA-binding transcriptional regulator [Neptunomonas phycophila]MDO6466587.1 LacI family DNA-binding transcriptional regulator [Neptunomonas phycophila]MDP2521004.1 LacI family DNA-binding transcriptional regulator [N
MDQSRYKHITQKEVADKAGVSLSAVSRAFTPGASVSEKTRKKIEAAANELGYKTNILAQSLMTNRTRLMGVISSNFENPAFIEVLDLITKELQSRGYRSLIENLTTESKPEDVLERLLQYRVDGVLFLSSVLPTIFAEVCEKAKLPAAIMFGRSSHSDSINTVTADNYNGGKMAIELLIDRGYKKIAFLGGPMNATTTIDRKQSAIETLKAHKLKLVAIEHCETYSYEAGKQKALELLEQNPSLEAIFCGDDILAIATLDTARELGKKCPEDFGVLGFNDMSMASWNAYNLTTIKQPIKEMVTAAVDIIIKRIEEPNLPTETRLLPCKLIERGTLKTSQKHTS